MTNEAKAFISLWSRAGESASAHLPGTHLPGLSVRGKEELKSALSQACEKHQKMAREAMGRFLRWKSKPFRPFDPVANAPLSQ